MGTTFIYALCEPGTRTVRYIGKTENPKRRLKEHLRQSSKKKTHLGYWIASLEASPEMIMLRQIEGKGCESEIHYIDLARRLGMNLVNSTDGGEGITQTAEIREKKAAKLRGRKRPPEIGAAIRARMTGVTWSEERRASQPSKKGVPWTDARRKAHKKDKSRSAKQLAVILAVNARKKGVKLSPEHRAKISVGITGDKNPFFGRKHTEETKSKISAARTNS